ncbi:MAG: isocitrate/isopropylmalate dehydrogenase family protein [Betaproteobacteria bacterium]|nr:isocitrate/isopropylmalate dehydrogenase family protein [Betaproteobacteria bacterium]MDH3435736.1 isocitrate/isopropylmalate dehydrogenase family protein [Betaproteobacteria bacterium]
MRRITLIPGDGIGPEVIAAARAVVEASGAAVAFEEVIAGQRAEREHGTPLPRAVFDSIEATSIALKGPTQTPFGGDYRVTIERNDAQAGSAKRTYPSISIALRRELGLFVAMRPIKNYPGIPSRYEKVDLVIFRENSEDLYVGVERMVDEGTAEAIKIISERGTERVTRFALDYMQRLGRRRLTIGHKANVMKMTDGLFLKTAQSIAKGRSDILVDQRVVDALCMDLVMRPEDYDCLLLPNLYGDMISDLAAGLVGGLGVAPGANFGADYATFEAVHGTAPDMAGKDVANPMASILSAVMMLRYIGEAAAADRIAQALAQVLKEKGSVTPDLGGNAGTRAMTEAIVQKLQRQ